MRVETFQFNPVEENTYVLYDETKECVIVDPGCFFHEEKAQLCDFIAENDLKVKHIINTHLHFDHIFGNHFVEQTYDLTTEANQEDEFLTEQLGAQLRLFGFDASVASAPVIGTYLNEGDVVTFGEQQLQIFHVPGHSPGSLVFYNKEAGCMFAGDVLFRGSVGRTDLVGGSYQQLIDGIKSKLLVLPPDTVVYSGHGPTTSIAYETKNNPYLQ